MSQVSQACGLASDADQSERLLAAIRAEGFRDALLGRATYTTVELSELDDDQLRGLVCMLHDDSLRYAGKPAPGDVAAAYCMNCGPLLWSPIKIGVSHTSDGMPIVLACPWCSVRAKGVTIPRPRVTCAGCRERWPDSVNPREGLSRCNLKLGVLRYPHEQHACAQWKPR